MEKFAGNINATTTKTGIQRGKIVFENEITSSLTFAKYIAYKLGRYERFLPQLIKQRMSMHRGYWLQ